MARFVRQGSCSRCGGCCGEDAFNPWPQSWPESLRTWAWTDFAQNYGKFLVRLGFAESPEGTVTVTNPYGSVKIQGTTYRWKIGPGIRKTDAQRNVIGNECPMLTGTTANTVRPCALEALPTQKAEAFSDALKCYGYIHTDSNPPPVFEDVPEGEGEAAVNVAEWFQWHPQCSYTYAQE